MPADWNAIENAIFDWAVAGSGLAEAAVVWAEQVDDSNRPAGQHVQLKLAGDVVLGRGPALRHKFDSGGAAGQEIRQIVDVVREIMLSVQVMGGPTTTSTSARAIAGKLQNSLRLPARNDALNTAGIAVVDVGKIEYVPEVLDADFEPRAVFDVKLYVADDAEERGTYISTVEIEDDGADEIFTVP